MFLFYMGNFMVENLVALPGMKINGIVPEN